MITSALAQATTAPTPEVSPFKFGAFADVRYTNFHVKNNPLISSGQPESGFGLEDGAFYANYDKEKLSVVLDVALRRSKDFDADTSATKPNQSSNNNFVIGADKSQLYLRYKITPTLIFDLGQFDTIFGLELNDSKDRVFGKSGLVSDNTLPVTHTGVMLEYTFLENYYFKVFAANPNNKGTYGSSSNGDDTLELGGAIGIISASYYVQVGYMSRSINEASGLTSGKRSLLDVYAGGNLGQFIYSFEYSLLSDSSKNSLTSGNSGDKEKAGVGYLSLLAYQYNPEFQIGVRIEYVKNDPTAQGIKSSSSAGLSLHYRLTPELELRSEYIAYKNKSVSENKWDDSRFNLAALVTF